jgi:Ca2+/H+ antiporter
MMQRETSAPAPRAKPRGLFAYVAAEAPTVAGIVIASLAVFALIIPNYTKTVPDPSLSPFQAGLFAVITILFYVVFLTIQTLRHRAFFAEPKGNGHQAGAAQPAPAHSRDGVTRLSRGHAPPHPCCPSCFCRSTWL